MSRLTAATEVSIQLANLPGDQLLLLLNLGSLVLFSADPNCAALSLTLR